MDFEEGDGVRFEERTVEGEGNDNVLSTEDLPVFDLILYLRRMTEM